MFFFSPSVVLGAIELSSDGAASDASALRASRAVLCCCNLCVILSTGSDSRIFSVAVGSNARTVKVQSSWFCSNRRRRLNRFMISSNTNLVLSYELTSLEQFDRHSFSLEPPRSSQEHIELRRIQRQPPRSQLLASSDFALASCGL